MFACLCCEMEFEINLFMQDSKYCYNVNYGDNNNGSISPTGSTHFVETEKEVTDGGNKGARKQEFEGNPRHYG